MESERHRVLLTDEAIETLRGLRKKYGKKNYHIVRDLISELEFNPEQRGVPLKGPLEGLYSLHYSRFRVIYQIDEGESQVLVVAAGDRHPGSPRDVYQILSRIDCIRPLDRRHHTLAV